MLPEKYSFVNKIGTLPKIVDKALRYYGLKEIAGAKSNPVIMEMADVLGVRRIYTNDDISWCAIFMAYVLKTTGKPMPYKGYDVLRAKTFAEWGTPVRLEDAKLGDIVVFSRPGGNHVAILIAVSKKAGKISTVHVLGGNQSNQVNIAEMSADRVTDVRRYYATAAPASAKQYVIDSTGKLSANES